MSNNRDDRVMSRNDVANMLEELEQTRNEAEENQAKYLRLLADQENYRKRLQRVFDDRLEEQSARVLRNLLDVLDNLERALSYGGDDPLTQGVQLTYRGLRNLLAQEGVRPMEAEGAAFDPELHEAVDIIPGNGHDGPDMVVAELTKGYLRNEKLLRAARVRVRKGTS